MQVTETLNEGLKRELQVVVPVTDITARADARIKEMSAKANIKGFRPGKVPVHHLKRLYGKSVMAEVVQETVNESSQQALEEQNLKPAYQPDIDLTEDEQEVSRIIDGKADLAYKMTFEVLPAIEIEDFSKIELEQLVADVEDSHIDEALANIAAEYKDYEDRDEGAPAVDGDQVTISFVGRVDGEAFEGGSAEDVPLVIGSGSFIPGFEDQLKGVKAGDDLTVKVTFPDEYQVESLAGKEAEFETSVSKVAAPVDAPMDDEFAKKLGLDDIAALRSTVSERIATELRQMSLLKLKRDVLDRLDEAYRFDLPAKLVDSEFEQIWGALQREMEQEKRTFEDEDTTEEEARKEYTEIAERRVRLGLVLGTIGEQAEISVADEEIERALIERVRQFPGQEKEVYEFYRKNPNAMIEIRGPIFEQKVVDHIVDKAKVAEKKVSREELAHELEHDHDDDYDHDHGEPEDEKPAKKAAKKAAKKTD